MFNIKFYLFIFLGGFDIVVLLRTGSSLVYGVPLYAILIAVAQLRVPLRCPAGFEPGICFATGRRANQRSTPHPNEIRYTLMS
jgi:hypothetical protein